MTAQLRLQADAEDIRFGGVLSKALSVFFSNAVRISLLHPSRAYFFLKTVMWQRHAAGTRARLAREGVHVPPIMIMSVTNRCNLNCAGCYNRALRHDVDSEISVDKLRSVVTETNELGISFIPIAGGEPFMRPELLDIAAEFPQIIFLIFTNGLLIDDRVIARFQKLPNVVPVISLEGYEADTDLRRGSGVYDQLKSIVSKFKNTGIFWSASLTVTARNLEMIASDDFVRQLFDTGCRLFFMIEYTPVNKDTENWLLTDSQRQVLLNARNHFRKQFPALFIAIPGDEDEIGGCLSAGRGFIHVNPQGNVEPCPFAPYSDTNLRDSSLRDALQSDFLRAVRANREQLHEGGHGGCALWTNRAWLGKLLAEQTRERDASSVPQ